MDRCSSLSDGAADGPPVPGGAMADRDSPTQAQGACTKATRLGRAANRSLLCARSRANWLWAVYHSLRSDDSRRALRQQIDLLELSIYETEQTLALPAAIDQCQTREEIARVTHEHDEHMNAVREGVEARWSQRRPAAPHRPLRRDLRRRPAPAVRRVPRARARRRGGARRLARAPASDGDGGSSDPPRADRTGGVA